MAKTYRTIDGVDMTFGSPIEADHYQELWYRQYNGEIRNLRQPEPFLIFPESIDGFGVKIPKVEYTPDAQYFDVKPGVETVDEVKAIRYYIKDGKTRTSKPTETQVVKLRYTLFRHRYPTIHLNVVYRVSERSRAPRRSTPKSSSRRRR